MLRDAIESSSLMKISHELLSPEALEGLLDEFISRDSSVWDSTIEEKRRQVVNALEKNRAVIVFDEETSSTHILTSDEYRQREREQDVNPDEE